MPITPDSQFREAAELTRTMKAKPEAPAPQLPNKLSRPAQTKGLLPRRSGLRPPQLRYPLPGTLREGTLWDEVFAK
jgi:hypothetical protein